MEKDNFNRQMILNMVEIHPLNISQIAERLRVSRPTVYLHLDVLKKKDLIEIEKDNKKKGAPVTVFIKQKQLHNHNTKKTTDFLRSVSKLGEIDHKEFFEKLGLDFTNPIYLEAGIRGYISKKIYVTPKGKQFIKDNVK